MNYSPEESSREEERTSLGHVLAEIARELGLLLRQEVDLARVELTRNAERAGNSALKFGMAAALGLAGVIVLAVAGMLGLTLLLSTLMPPTAAAFVGALAVALALGSGAWILFRRGRAELRNGALVPRRTLESLKENAEWATRPLR